MCLRRIAALCLGIVLLLGAPSVAWAAGTAPVDGPVERGFDPPAQRWLRGHRGVDLRAKVGDPVRAARGGVISYAGILAGRGVVVVTHGELRTTYEPVTASVRVGEQVVEGQVIGRLETGHACGAHQCLHWGLKRGEAYLDPLSLLDTTASDVLLLPESAIATARQRAAARAATAGDISSETGPGILGRPVPGPIGSRFGMRFHPIFHVWRLHAGVDLRAGCGTTIRAAADGRVLSVSYDSSGGHRLVIDHGTLGGRHVTTSYLHAQGYRVHSGQRVRRGEAVGTVGSTGWSTGCHLHFSVKVNGSHVDPAKWL